MTTVESIIKDYLDRGYSMEELRQLAVSSPGELGSTLLAVLDGMAGGGAGHSVAPAAEEDSGPCETAAYPVVMDDEDMVFFVAGDEEEIASGGEEESYDVMAATSAEDESVADIVIGETDGSGLVRSHSIEAGSATSATKGLISAEAAKEQTGIFNRLWSKVATKKTSSSGSSIEKLEKLARLDTSKSTKSEDAQEYVSTSDNGLEASGNPEYAGSLDEDSGIADVSGSALYFSASSEESSIAVAEASEVVMSGTTEITDTEGGMNVSASASLNASPVVDGNVAQLESEEQLTADTGEQSAMRDESANLENSSEMDVVGDDGVTRLVASESSSSFFSHSEISADYLPGSVSDLYDEAGNEPEQVPETLEEARLALLEAQKVLSGEHISEDAVHNVDSGTNADVTLEFEEDSVSDSVTNEGVAASSAEAAFLDSAPALDAALAFEEDSAAEHNENVNTENGGLCDASGKENNSVEEGLSPDAVSDMTTENGSVVSERCSSTVDTAEEPAKASVHAAPEEGGNADSVKSIKGRRKRERARRKKARKEAKAAMGALPEIVLTKSEGTETLMPEEVSEPMVAELDSAPADLACSESSDESSVLACSGESEESGTFVDAQVSDTASRDTADAVQDEAASVKDGAAKAARTFLTPLDLLGEDSDVEELLGLEPEALSDVQTTAAENTDAVSASQTDENVLAESEHSVDGAVAMPAQEDESALLSDVVMALDAPEASGVETNESEVSASGLAGEPLPGDHLMIISGGGVAKEEYEALLPVSASANADTDALCDSDETSLDAAASVDMEECAEEDNENVILFNEKFPVFAGIRADSFDESEESVEYPAGFGLRMLSYEGGDVSESGAEEQGMTDEAAGFMGLTLLSGNEDEVADTGVVASDSSSESEGVTLAEEPLMQDEAEEPAATALEEAAMLETEVVNGSDNIASAEAEDAPASVLDESAAIEACAADDAERMLEYSAAALMEEMPVAVMLPAPVGEALLEEDAVALDDAGRGVLLRALYGVADDFSGDDDECEDFSALHAIVTEEPEPASDNSLEHEAAVRAEMEVEYQERMDEFAARILQIQTAQAADVERLQQKQVELDARSAIIEEMQKRLDAEEMRIGELSGKLAEANSKLDEKDTELKARDKERNTFTEMRTEHGRLYKEFEDLRKGYNEIVTDVLPKLQTERDDLVLTVERQCEDEEKMRSSLGSVRRRLAVGYSLAGAACLALCALPVAYWVKTGRADREMAFERQKLAELHETLQREVQSNIVARNTIVELENKMGMARAQLTDLHRKNQELARLSRPRQGQDVAVFKPSAPASAGTPTRTSEMALQATTQPGGRLHVNQVRDPSGSIEELAYQNRQANEQRESSQMARANDSLRPIALNAVSTPDTSSSRPPRLVPPPPLSAPAQTRPAGGNSRTAPVAVKPVVASRPGEVAAKVKKGEGVAQVVYRVLGTWDPDVIAWVVKENKLTMDKKGNPRIHPDQELRIPASVGMVQSVASGRKR